MSDDGTKIVVSRATIQGVVSTGGLDLRGGDNVGFTGRYVTISGGVGTVGGDTNVNSGNGISNGGNIYIQPGSASTNGTIVVKDGAGNARITVSSDGTVTEAGTHDFTGTLRAPRKSDPGSPLVGEAWVNGADLKFRDNQGSPATQTVERQANKGAASGYASLDAGALVPAAQLGTGTANSTKVLRGDRSWISLTTTGGFPVVLSPQGNEPPSSNFATFDTRNGHPLLDFDDTTSESAIWTRVLPASYGGNGLTVDVYFAMTSATTGNVGWRGYFERMNTESLDIDSDSFASAQSATVAVPGTSGHVKKATIAFTDGQIDGLLAGEMFRFKLDRDPTVGSDASGDAELLLVTIRET